LPNEMDPGYPGRVYLYENQPSKTSILNYWIRILLFSSLTFKTPTKIKFKKKVFLRITF
jgi:hypothetical protein